MKSFFSLLFIAFSCGVFGQAASPFKTLRYDEDYRFLAKDSTPSLYEKLKYIPLSQSGRSYLSLGAEVRYQYFAVRNEDWGDAPRDKDGYLLSRFLINSDWHTGHHFRFFFQLQGSMANGKASGTSPVDENPLEIHQAFEDINDADKKYVLRVGRQELSYGSQRLISVRELPNNRQSFDALKLIIKRNQFRIDGFAGRYVSARKGLFDDVSNKDIHLWGLYAVFDNFPVIGHIDLYYLGFHRLNSSYNDGTGDETRHSMGARIWGNLNGFSYDFESLYQFGSFASKHISAWTASANLSYKWKGTPLQPEAGLKTEVISGDRKEGDNRLETFNPLFPRGAYFGLAALIGPYNLFDIHPSFSLQILKNKLTWSIDNDVFWRQSRHDGIYAVNGALLYGASPGGSSYIGNQLATDFTLTPNRFILIRSEATWFHAGSYLKDVSRGKDILFLGITTQLKF